MKDLTTPDRYYTPDACGSCGYIPNNRDDEISHYTDPTACDPTESDGMEIRSVTEEEYNVNPQFPVITNHDNGFTVSELMSALSHYPGEMQVKFCDTWPYSRMIGRIDVPSSVVTTECVVLAT